MSDELDVMLSWLDASNHIGDISKRLRYERRAVLFLDVLGWTELTAESRRDRAAFHRLASIALAFAIESRMTRRLASDPSVFTFFSDSLIVSWPAPRSRRERLFLVLDVANRLWDLFRHRVLVRGGFTIGHIHHKPGVVFGPALVRAHFMESKEARVPRVLVDDELTTGMPPRLVARDSDGRQYIDFLRFGAGHAAYPRFLVDAERFVASEYRRALRIADSRKRASLKTKLAWLRRRLQACKSAE